MTTMASDEDTPRLAEIARTLSDMRAEFRSALEGMIRRDVYNADMRTQDVKINGLQSQVSQLGAELEKERQQKSNTRNTMLTAVFTAGLSLVVTIVSIFIQAGH